MGKFVTNPRLDYHSISIQSLVHYRYRLAFIGRVGLQRVQCHVAKKDDGQGY